MLWETPTKIKIEKDVNFFDFESLQKIERVLVILFPVTRLGPETQVLVTRYDESLHRESRNL